MLPIGENWPANFRIDLYGIIKTYCPLFSNYSGLLVSSYQLSLRPGPGLTSQPTSQPTSPAAPCCGVPRQTDKGRLGAWLTIRFDIFALCGRTASDLPG